MATKKLWNAPLEEDLHLTVVRYLKALYPRVIFRTDFAAGTKLTYQQAAKHQQLQHGRGFPDLFIAKGATKQGFNVGVITDHYTYREQNAHNSIVAVLKELDAQSETTTYHGLFIELKREGTRLKKKRDGDRILSGDYKIRKAGDWADIHIEEQANMIYHLRNEGYFATFAVGFDDAKEIIDWYLAGNKNAGD